MVKHKRQRFTKNRCNHKQPDVVDAKGSIELHFGIVVHIYNLETAREETKLGDHSEFVCHPKYSSFLDSGFENLGSENQSRDTRDRHFR